MPFGKWSNWEACIADIGKKNPDYSEESVKRVCGKLKEKLEKCKNPDAAYSAVARHLEKADADSVAPMTADIDKKHAQMEIKKSWMHELHGILNSPRVAEMTFHVPKVDKDMEFITPGAMAGALQDYMKFPIISEFHKERPIGIAEKVWQTNEDEFKARIRIRDDPSTDDVWEKMNLPMGTPGRYDQVSIAGKRIVYSQECNMPLPMRKATRPCRTEKLRLDSVSVCDDRARNDGTELNVVKALSDDQVSFVYTTALDLTKVEDNLIKAETTESELIHPVTDGANQADNVRSKGTIINPLIETDTRKGGKMKKGNDPKVKKTSEEEGQEPVEETEAKKGTEEDTDPEKQVEKAPPKEEEKEDAKKAEDPYQEILKLLRELVASDKKVHKEVEKAEEKPAEKKEEKKEEKEEKCVKKAGDEEVTKAAMEQDFQKALDAAIAPLRTEIDLLKAEVQKIGDEPLLKAGIYLKELQVDKDGQPEKGNAGMIAEQRKKTAGKK